MMKTLLKLLLVVLAGVALLLAGLWVLVEPEDYREKLSQAASDALGTEVVLQGDMRLSVWPSIGLSSEQLQIMQPREFGEGVLLEAGRISFSAAAMPLLQGQLELGEIRLQGVRLKLIREQNGRANWSLLQAGDTSASKPVATDTPDSPLKVRLSGLYLDDVQLDFEDRQQGSRQQLQLAHFSLEGLGGQEPARMSLKARAQLPETFELDLQGQLKLSEDFSQVELSSMSLQIRGESLPEPVSVQGGMKLDTKQGVLQLRSLRLLEQIEISGTLGEKINLQVRANGQDLAPWLGDLPLKPELDKTLDLELDIQGSSKKLKVALKKGRFGNLDLQGQARWNGSLNASLRTSALRLEDWLPDTGTRGEGSAASVETEGPLLAPEQLPGIHAELNLEMEALEAQGLKLKQVRMQVRTRPGRVELSELTAALYQGKLRVQSVLEAKNGVVGLQSSGAVQGVQAEPLLQDLTDKALLSGQGEVSWNLNTSLASATALKEQLAGEASLRFQDGAVLGINVAERIRQGWAMLKGQPYEAPKEPPRTDFAELSASLRLQAGRVENEDLLLKSPLLRVSGNGWLDLAGEQINYNLRPVVVGTLRGQDGEELKELKGVPIPLKIKGDLNAPRIKLDLARAFSQQQKKKLKKKAEKEVMKLLFGKPKKQPEESQQENPPQ